MRQLKKSYKGYLYILPALLIYGFFVLYSSLQNLFYSFFDWTNITTRKFSGISNYIALFKDKKFYTTISHNFIWAALTVILLMLFLLISVFLVRNKGRLVFSVIYFLPVTIPFVVSAIMWGWIYNPDFGVIKYVLDKVHLSNLNQFWLSNPKIALYSLFIVGTWTYFGFCIVIFLSALQSQDQSIYEAARIDGASDIKCFFHITIPALRSTISFLTIWSIIGAMKFFDIVYIMTKGGPGNSTEVLSTYIFKLAFREQKIGYASSISMILMIIVVGLAAIIFRRSNEE
ncbi:MAG: carbohydrate ABC transporter permease [Candidatus Humimicrobiaceae bacterium]